MVMLLIYKLVVLISVIISIPFLTLLERKLLSYIQNRRGPNKVSFLGLLQPIFDGMKLISKEASFLNYSKMLVFLVSPMASFLMMVLLWLFMPFYHSIVVLNLTIIFLFCMMSSNMYSLMGSGWSSKSKFSLLGSIRGASQVISYEVSLIVLILPLCIMISGYKLWVFYNKNFFFFFSVIIMLIIWLMMILVETKRAPFDFAEGESELVSGFNTEYSSLGFALLFLGEYGSIMWISFFSCMLFFYFNLFFYKLVLFLMIYFIWVRGTFVRFRYDLLMIICWKVILPLGILLLSGFMMNF